MRSVLIFLACLLLGSPSLAGANENRFQQFNNDVDQAYAFYRQALFQTNKKDAGKSTKANDKFLTQWQTLIAQYNSQPPEVFGSDSEWQSTLSNIEKIAVESAAQIKEGQLAEAHETLEAIRDELTELRKRNSVIVFSDHINNYHEVMEGLLVGGYAPDKIDEQATEDIMGQLAVLSYLAEAIKKNAPAEYRENQKYQQLEKALLGSLKALEESIDKGNPESISKSINDLKPAYAKLFVNFG